MIKNLIIPAGLIWCIQALSVFQCSSGGLAGPGNSSETQNGITVTASSLSIYGKTRPGAFVGLYSADYVPLSFAAGSIGSSDTMNTDTSGTFSFTPGRESLYNLYVQDRTDGKARFIRNIPLYTGSEYHAEFRDLAASGPYFGSSAPDYAISSARIVVLGSPFTAQVQPDGSYGFEALPQGSFQIAYYTGYDVVTTSAIPPDPKNLIVFDTITVVSGEPSSRGE